MPLFEPTGRRELHHRVIDMRTYARDDGLYDVEAHLIDTKPFDFQHSGRADALPAGAPLHDLWVRVTVDDQYVIQRIEAASDATPFALCKEAEPTLNVLVGQRIGKGWSSVVKDNLRGTASCTHLRELLIPLATTLMQGVRGVGGAPSQVVDANGKPIILNSCYAYAEHRDVVKRRWPQHFKSPTQSASD
ncbi:DUF2889 domain-containing protein [Burkholderia sp. Bp8990]|uniref:DUF2889 domain-containing protein n=1 Tax=Burkholderia sp. Bp8990 TaxID=2184552 RepID=UPI000F5A6F97|nr:DUF2889 domain-containing protein [Burkholderia sp. Bp8990]